MTTTPTLLEVEEVGPPSADGGPPTSTRRILTKLGRDKAALLCVAFLLLVILMAAFAPLITKISGWGPYEFDSAAINSDLGGVPHGALGGISGGTGSGSSRRTAGTCSPGSSTAPGCRSRSRCRRPC